MSKESNQKKDRVIADSGWGIKPDDQPANVDEAGKARVNGCQYDPHDPEVVRTILQLQRRSFNSANKVLVEPGKVTIVDLNGDPFVVHGLSYGDNNLVELLKTLGASFNPQLLLDLPADFDGVREYALSRATAWGAERTG